MSGDEFHAKTVQKMDAAAKGVRDLALVLLEVPDQQDWVVEAGFILAGAADRMQTLTDEHREHP